MSSTSSELNALATTTTVDILKRNFDHVDDKNIVYYTKLMTLFWGLCAVTIACFAYLADNLIQLVNIIGSIFYGNVLGIFLIAFFFNKIQSNAVFSKQFQKPLLVGVSRKSMIYKILNSTPRLLRNIYTRWKSLNILL